MRLGGDSASLRLPEGTPLPDRRATDRYWSICLLRHLVDWYYYRVVHMFSLVYRVPSGSYMLEHLHKLSCDCIYHSKVLDQNFLQYPSSTNHRGMVSSELVHGQTLLDTVKYSRDLILASIQNWPVVSDGEQGLLCSRALCLHQLR